MSRFTALVIGLASGVALAIIAGARQDLRQGAAPARTEADRDA
jgi:hypothetical protein